MNRCPETKKQTPATSPATTTAAAVQPRLKAWFTKAKRDLPWRGTQNPYAIWISEVMLQQTQVRTVLAYYSRFMQSFPDVTRLARSDLQTVLKVWEGLGYYKRARNLHRAAGIVVDRMGGRIPSQWRLFRSLPGVGDYIASAVMSIAFDQPFAVVDGNVKRVLARLLRLDGPVNQTSAKKSFQQAADMLLDAGNPGDHNQAMMELGALVCTPRSPACTRCPLTTSCRAYRDGVTDHYPRRIPRPRIPQQHMVACVIQKKKGLILIVRRPSEGLLGGMWEFPAGVIQPEEEPSDACTRVAARTVHVKISGTRPVATIRHTYTHFRITMEVFLCQWLQGRVRVDGPVEFRWIDPRRISEYPIHRAVLKAWPRIKELLN